MSGVIRTFLAVAGLAPASEIERLNADAQRMQTALAQLERQLEQARADTQGWKRRHEDTAEAAAGWKQASQRAQAESELAKKDAQRLKADLDRTREALEREQQRTEEWKDRAESVKAELVDVRSRLEQAQGAAEAANEQLMAMEVKLDLIEAAIQVLDVRTRQRAFSGTA